MADAMRAIPSDHALIQAWQDWKKTDDFINNRKWAHHSTDHIDGVLWGAFIAGFNLATERAARLHENVDPASDEERQDGSPGAGAMGAVIGYRDAIRKVEANR